MANGMARLLLVGVMHYNLRRDQIGDPRLVAWTSDKSPAGRTVPVGVSKIVFTEHISHTDYQFIREQGMARGLEVDNRRLKPGELKKAVDEFFESNPIVEQAEPVETDELFPEIWSSRDAAEFAADEEMRRRVGESANFLREHADMFQLGLTELCDRLGVLQTRADDLESRCTDQAAIILLIESQKTDLQGKLGQKHTEIAARNAELQVCTHQRDSALQSLDEARLGLREQDVELKRLRQAEVALREIQEKLSGLGLVAK